MPQTRSGISYGTTETKKKITVNINFDEAHREWIKNKIKLQNGLYIYKNKKQ